MKRTKQLTKAQGKVLIKFKKVLMEGFSLGVFNKRFVQGQFKRFPKMRDL